MLTLVAVAAVFLCAGIVVGAYSHKYLQRITGAPSNITSVTQAADAIKQAAANAAHSVADAAHADAKAAIAKLQ